MTSIIRLPIASPECFVVRVYRRDPRAPGRIEGTVEVVASGRELGFAGLREMQAVITASMRPSGTDCDGAGEALPEGIALRGELKPLHPLQLECRPASTAFVR